MLCTEPFITANAGNECQGWQSTERERKRDKTGEKNYIKATLRILFQKLAPVPSQSLPSSCPIRGPLRWVPPELCRDLGAEGLQGSWGRAGTCLGGCPWAGLGPGCPGSGRGGGAAMLPGTPAPGGCQFLKPPAHVGEPTPTGVTASCRRASAGGCGKGQGRAGGFAAPHPPSPAPSQRGRGAGSPVPPPAMGKPLS